MLTEHDSHVENSGTAAAVEYCPNITVSGALAGEVDMTSSAECGHCADSDDGCHGGDSYLTTPPVLACTPASPAQPQTALVGLIIKHMRLAGGSPLITLIAHTGTRDTGPMFPGIRISPKN